MAGDPRKFFASPQPAAILKHEVLKRYVTVFASKTGSRSGGEVTFIDGYAGPGLYDDKSPGSPALAVELAKEMDYRLLTCRFIEKDKAFYSELATMIAQEAAPLGLPITAHHGAVEDHLPGLVASAGSQPLFVFLDPFGVGIDFDMLTGTVLGRSKSNYPKTEVLLNFTSPGLDRCGGMIKSSAKNAVATLETMRRTLGGDWWQEIYMDAPSDDRLQLIARNYRQRVAEAAGGGWGGWTVPVSDKFDARPEYMLLHFTQHPDGRWEFHEALSHATAAWRAAVHSQHPTVTDRLEAIGQFTFPGLVEFEEDESAWVAEIERNARRMVAEGKAFIVQDELGRLLGRSLGMAREKHIRAALRCLWNEGLLRDQPKGKLQRFAVAPTPMS